MAPMSGRPFAGGTDVHWRVTTCFLHFFISQDDNLTGKFGTTREVTARLRERERERERKKLVLILPGKSHYKH